MFTEEVKKGKQFSDDRKQVWEEGKSVGDVVRLAEAESRVVVNICVKLGDLGNLTSIGSDIEELVLEAWWDLF